jgi:hypothetical protein
VYHHKLGFLESVNQEDIYIRTSTEPRTFQVAGGMLFGMDQNTAKQDFAAHVQPGNVNSLAFH